MTDRGNQERFKKDSSFEVLGPRQSQRSFGAYFFHKTFMSDTGIADQQIFQNAS